MKQNEQEKAEDWQFLLKKMEIMQLSEMEKEMIKLEIIQRESDLFREKQKIFKNHHIFNFFHINIRRKKISAEDFESLTIIGKGSFGEVRLCRVKETGLIVAIKKLKKSEMFIKNQIIHVRAERDVLAKSNNPWIVELICSFQVKIIAYII